MLPGGKPGSEVELPLTSCKLTAFLFDSDLSEDTAAKAHPETLSICLGLVLPTYNFGAQSSID